MIVKTVDRSCFSNGFTFCPIMGYELYNVSFFREKTREIEVHRFFFCIKKGDTYTLEPLTSFTVIKERLIMINLRSGA